MDEHIQTEEKAIATIIATYKDREYNIIKKAEVFSFLFNLYNSINKINELTGIHRTAIRRYLKIDNLPLEVKQLILSEKIIDYVIASELTRIKDKNRLIETANSLIGIPREIGREIIRYILKNDNKEVIECVNIIKNLYGDIINIRVYVYNKDEFEIKENPRLLTFNEISKQITDLYSLPGQLIIKLLDENIFVIISDEQINALKKELNKKINVKKLIKKAIENVQS